MNNLDTTEALVGLHISGPQITGHTNHTSDIKRPNHDGGIAITSTKPPYPRVMTLNIGGRKIQISPNTLYAESGLFRQRLSDRFTWAPEADGSYFLDADPDLFEHLVRFMRRPNVVPLSYDNVKGYNYDLYNRLEAEADYFQVEVLRAWIKEKKFLKAIVTQTYNPRLQIADELVTRRYPVNESEDMYMMPRIKKGYICPREIGVHRDNPSRCGAACKKAQGDDNVECEEEWYVEVVSVKKATEFVEAVCMAE
jgi:hypothetical protein